MSAPTYLGEDDDDDLAVEDIRSPRPRRSLREDLRRVWRALTDWSPREVRR